MNNATENKMVVANTILAQLGGNKFAMMTGAKNFVGDTDSLTFKLPANFARNGINLVRVTLNAMDTYDIEFMKFRALKITSIFKSSGVFADMLQTVFTDVTGLDTHL